ARLPREGLVVGCPLSIRHDHWSSQTKWGLDRGKAFNGPKAPVASRTDPRGSSGVGRSSHPPIYPRRLNGSTFGPPCHSARVDRRRAMDAPFSAYPEHRCEGASRFRAYRSPGRPRVAWSPATDPAKIDVRLSLAGARIVTTTSTRLRADEGHIHITI